MILSAQSIRKRVGMIEPFHERTQTVWKLSYGLGPASYDVCCKQDLILYPNEIVLASTVEKVNIPNDLVVSVKDKSSWARQGVTVQNTHLDPGFKGYVTLEICNHTNRPIKIHGGMPIAQFVFELLDEPTEQPYNGKYQNQDDKPVEAK